MWIILKSEINSFNIALEAKSISQYKEPHVFPIESLQRINFSRILPREYMDN